MLSARQATARALPYVMPPIFGAAAAPVRRVGTVYALCRCERPVRGGAHLCSCSLPHVYQLAASRMPRRTRWRPPMMQPPDRRNQGPLGPQGSNGQNPNQQSFWRRNLIWIILLAIIPWIFFLVWQPNNAANSAEPVSYTMFIDQVKARNVSAVTLSDNSVTGTFVTPVRSDISGQTGTRFSTTIPNLYSENTVPLMEQNNVRVQVSSNNNNFWLGAVLQFLPILLLIAA